MTEFIKELSLELFGLFLFGAYIYATAKIIMFIIGAYYTGS
jgi:hypothetical protein